MPFSKDIRKHKAQKVKNERIEKNDLANNNSIKFLRVEERQKSSNK